MIPIELTIKGIYSYQKEQVIDFTRLTEGNLFGIFGAVGSGKSTILEAITLALYNNTERLGEKGDNRYYNMMNLKSNELLIRFVFKAGSYSEDEYLVEVQGKRNRKDFANVSQYSRRVFKKVKSEWIPTEAGAEEILGLSYENFRRTIIIPQGKFQEFLQLTEGKRTQMMKELFFLERFDLQYKTKSLFGKNEAAIQHISGQLKEVESVTEEMIKEKETLLKQLRKQLKKAEKKLREKEKRERAQHALKELFQKISRLQEELENLRKQEEDFRRREAQSEDYQYCRVEFKGLIERGSEIARRIVESEAELQEHTGVRGELESRLSAEEERFKKLKLDYRDRSALKQKAEELERIIQIHELNADIESLSIRLEREKQKSAEAQQKIEELLREKEQIDQTIKNRRKAMPNREELAEIRNWFTAEAHLKTSLITLEEEDQKLQQAGENIDVRKNRVLDEPGLAEWITPIERSLPLNSLLDALASSQKKIDKEFSAVEQEIDHLRLQAGLETLASELADDRPCPVCGSHHHPNPMKSKIRLGKLRKLEGKREELREKAKMVSEARQQLSGLQGEFLSREEMRRHSLKKQEAEQKKLEKHRKNFRWEEFAADDPAQVETALQLAASIEDEIAALAQQQEALEKQLEKTRKEKEVCQEVLAKSEQTYSAKSSGQKVLINQLKVLDYRQFRETNTAELEAEAAKLAEEHEKLEVEYQQAEESVNGLHKELDTLSGQISALEKNIQKYREQQEKVENETREKLAQSKFDDIGAVEKMLALDLDTAAEKKAIEEFFRKLHSAGEQLQQLQAEREGSEFDETAYRQLLEEIEALKTDLSRENQEIGGLSAEIEKLKESLQTKAKLQQQLGELEKRRENLSTLGSLFRGSGFVSFVSTVYLRNLCLAANERFRKLTRQQLHLEVTDSNSFQVRDFLHGGQVRSIKTLSGGQTFQAALSLALALADNIQKLSDSGQNFFFLDEGFGALDRESLRIVFDTLKSLRKEKRIVGVISHVEDMQQEIDVYLKIRNDEEKGSMISASWEV